MLEQLSRFMRLRRLARETRGLRQDLHALTAGILRIAAALELRNAHDYPQVLRSTEDRATEVSFVREDEQAEFMDIELRLTQASGQPPTEDEILQEYWRRHQPPAEGPAEHPPS